MNHETSRINGEVVIRVSELPNSSLRNSSIRQDLVGGSIPPEVLLRVIPSCSIGSDNLIVEKRIELIVRTTKEWN
jgi:hypothetical protein